MTRRLTDRRILITGGASGIGRATAELFLSEGAQVAVVDVATGATGTEGADGAVRLVADVSDEAAICQAVSAAAESMGGLDGLVNSAAIFRYTPIDLGETSDWRRILDINVIGTALTCRAAVPWLRRADASTIVNIASGAALRPNAGTAIYSASKAAIVGMTRVLSLDLGPKIRVNCVCPGRVETPMLDTLSLEQPPDPSAWVIPRVGMPSEIAKGILYLTSAESSYVTGTTLAIDGGKCFH